MFLGGHINLKGPDFEKKFITFESEISGEFYLQTEKGTLPVVDDFDIWIQMDKDKEIKITTDYADEQELCDDICIHLTSGKNDIAFSLSSEQAAALSQVLQHYVTAIDNARELGIERVVKAA